MKQRTLIFALSAALLSPAVTSSSRAERLEATNNTPATVDGESIENPPILPPVVRSVTFDGTELNFGSGEVLDVDISITFTKAHDPNDPLIFQNPFFNEIGFALRSPDGTLVELIPVQTFLGPPNFNGSTFDFSGTIVLDDAASDPVDQGPVPGKPNVGTYQPINALSAFNGENALGTWELLISDDLGGHPLEFSEFTLSVLTAVPEPGSIALAAVGLLGLMAYGMRPKAQRPNSSATYVA